MPATVIAEQIERLHSMTVVNPCLGDPSGILGGGPGGPVRAPTRRYDAVRSVDPKVPTPLGAGQRAQMPVSGISYSFAPFISATVFPFRMAGHPGWGLDAAGPVRRSDARLVV